jgi:hypothetical protein
MDYRQLRYRVEKYSTFSRASRCLCKHPDSVKLMSWSSSTKRALSGFTAVCKKKLIARLRADAESLAGWALHLISILHLNYDGLLGQEEGPRLLDSGPRHAARRYPLGVATDAAPAVAGVVELAAPGAATDVEAVVLVPDVAGVVAVVALGGSQSRASRHHQHRRCG